MKCLELSQTLSKVLVLIAVLFSTSLFAKEEIQIILKEIVYTKSEEIKLKDIATIKNVSNKKLEQYIKNITVLKTESKTVITKQNVIISLKDNFIDLSKIIIIGNQTIVIPERYTITSEDIKKSIKKYLLKKEKIKIKEILIPSFEAKVLGKPKINIEEENRTKNRIYLNVNIKNIKNIKATVIYVPVEKVLIATNDLPKGKIINKEDFVLKDVEIRRNKNYIKDVNLILGRKLKRFIRKGQPIQITDLEPEFLVKRNAEVLINYRKGAFRLTIKGKALENGEIGEFIKVINKSSGKIIQCKVIGKNQVEFISGQ